MEIALHVHVVRRILSNIFGYSTGPIFTIFSPYECALRADDGSRHVTRFKFWVPIHISGMAEAGALKFFYKGRVY